MPPEITLVPYTEVPNKIALTERLMVLAHSAEEHLRVEMPYVLKRYSNQIAALASVNRVCQNMNSRNDFAAFVVECDGSAIGVVTYDQQVLDGPRQWMGFRAGMDLANGPLIAGWLGRVDRPKGLALPVLRALAAKMVANTYLTGHPWTVVRAGHIYARRALADINNGFSGFEQQGSMSDYVRIDGVEIPRYLCIGRHNVDSLRG